MNYPASKSTTVSWDFLFACGLWLTISAKGMSKPLFFSSGLAVHGKVYSTKCLPVAAAFIQKHHAGEDVAFWSDLASAHYAERSLEEMECSTAAANRKFLG